MATYKATEPNTGPVVGTDALGSRLEFKFDEDGLCVVPDDFQEAHVILGSARGVELVKEKKGH